MGFLMGYLNGPTAVLRRCAADCLTNLTSLPNLACLLHESVSGGKLRSSQLMQSLAARVADSAESLEVRLLSCQTLVNTLHTRSSGALQATPPQLLLSSFGSLLHLPCAAFCCRYFLVLWRVSSCFQPIETTERGECTRYAKRWRLESRHIR